MKKIAILMALAMVATASLGAINVEWSCWGFLSGVEGSSLYATEEADSILWELVYTSGSSIATPVLDESTGAISYGSDQVLSSRLWESGSADVAVTDVVESKTPSAQLLMDIEGGCLDSEGASYKNLDYTQSSGGIYSAVFQFCSNGDVYYALTDLNTGINWANEMSAADQVCFNMEEDIKIATKLGTVTTVPEPATMSLLGLGALAMVLRRKLRK
jgi:hypothetical protein